MTAKRVTIGAKPTLVHRDEGMQAENEPTDANRPAAASIEEWLRQGEASAATGEGDAAPTLPEAAEAEATEAMAPAPTALPPSAAERRVSAGGALPPWAGIAGGAIAGAAVAAAIAWLAPQLSTASDPRIAPLTERVAQAETQLRDLGERIGKVDNELAQTLDDQSTATERLAQQGEQIAALTEQVAADSRRTDPVLDVASPLFAVALGQLRTTFYSGRPFEAELVNVYAIAGNNELFSGYLTELMGPARTGVPNAAELYRVFPSYVTAAGLRIGDADGYVQYGLSLVNRYVGIATEPHSVEMSNLAVTRASAALAAGNVAVAVSALGELDPRAADVMTPWLDAARGYLRAETAITEMTRIVVERLRERAKNAPGTAGDALSDAEADMEPAAGATATLPSAAVPVSVDPAEAIPKHPAAPAAEPQATAP